GPSRVMAHALVQGALAAAQNKNAMVGATGAATGELVGMMATQLYHKDASQLTEGEKETVSTLATLAAGLAGGLTGDSTANALAGAQTGKTVVENNYLSDTQKAQRDKELSECTTVQACLQTRVKWGAVDLGQDGSFAAGMAAGVPASLYETAEGIVKAASSPIETLDALKTLFNSDDALGAVSEAVKQSYIARIEKLKAEYQKAGASGSFNAGVESGKLVTDIAGLVAGGAGLAKGGVVLTEKVVAKVAGKTESVAINVGKASSGAENAATYPKLKDDLIKQNLNNIAKLDPRLAEAVKGSGTTNPNFSIGLGTVADAERLGKVWVGDGGKLVENQKKCPGCWVSADGSLIYRPPVSKKSQFAITGVQANFQILDKSGVVISNGHLNITK
ncbi:VENN motif pre-toxin domain-containing protein, partial [Aeromonas veronii]